MSYRYLLSQDIPSLYHLSWYRITAGEMSLPFSRLSTELVLEIIPFAASPEVDCLNSIYGRRGTYTSALALTKVSYDFRQAAMPHLLRTIILSTSLDVHLFIQTLLRQCWFRQHFPSLALEYKLHVRRLWCTESMNFLYDGHDFETMLGWDLFRDLLFNVQSLGLGIHSFHLLNDLTNLSSLSHPHTTSQSLVSESCSRITFCGPFFHWDLVTSTIQGIRFLAGITHLTLWITDCTIAIPSHPRIPSWVGAIPFHLLDRLEHLEVLLIPELNEEELDQVGYHGEYLSPHPLEVLVITLHSLRDSPGYERSKEVYHHIARGRATLSLGAYVIEERLRSSDPFAYGVVSPLCGISRTAAANAYIASSWESHFLEG